MTEAELLALAALVQQETLLMQGANTLREIQDYSPAYGDEDWGPYAVELSKELSSRFTSFPSPVERKDKP